MAARLQIAEDAQGRLVASSRFPFMAIGFTGLAVAMIWIGAAQAIAPMMWTGVGMGAIALFVSTSIHTVFDPGTRVMTRRRRSVVLPFVPGLNTRVEAPWTDLDAVVLTSSETTKGKLASVLIRLANRKELVLNQGRFGWDEAEDCHDRLVSWLRARGGGVAGEIR